jgi:hypothetical protein
VIVRLVFSHFEVLRTFGLLLLNTTFHENDPVAVTLKVVLLVVLVTGEATLESVWV